MTVHVRSLLFLPLFLVLFISVPLTSSSSSSDIFELDDDSYNSEVHDILCADDEEEKPYCPIWRRLGGCRFTKYMRRYCAKTCNLCDLYLIPAYVVPQCAKEKYGCCWDNTTIAEGPVSDPSSSRCPPCIDTQSRFFCRRFKDKCTSQIQGQGDTMRTKCPVTCKIPCDTNLDSMSEFLDPFLVEEF